MIPSLLYLDRHRNEGTRTYSQHAAYSEARECYRPDSETDAFLMPAFLVPLERLNLYHADPDPVLSNRYVSPEGALFCVHPQVLEDAASDPYLREVLELGGPREEILVSPSSSTRTLYVRDAPSPHALKVHFPFRVSRYGRRMRDEVVAQAIRVSSEIQAGRDAMGRDFAFLREVLGVTYRNLDPGAPRGENWGYLVRDLRPFPTTGAERALVPGFSLYGRDFFDPGCPPLLFELMGGPALKTRILEEIMFPIIRHWVTCFRTFGLLLEPHGQNVLLEMGEEGAVARIVHRDLNLGIDTRRRRQLGLAIDESNTYNQMETGDFNSITYDKFMGGHFFDHLVSAAIQRDDTLCPEDFRYPCREEFARIFPDHEDYLPRSVRYFSEKRDRFGKPLFQDTGDPPAWRP